MNETHPIDIIRELINIGIGEAANSLSKLVNTRVIIRVPDVYIMTLPEVREYIKREVASLGVYISQNFSELIKGKTVLFYTKDCCLSLLEAICGQNLKTSSLTETGIATLNEIGNIIMGSCMAEISDMINGKISFELPEVTVDISESYFQNILKEMDALDQAVVVKNEMRVKDTDIRGYLFILMSFEDLKMVTEIIQKKVNGE